MDKCWWHAAWGFCLLQLSLAQQKIDLNITCRFAGVFHVEKNGRYSISRTEAADLCEAFNSTLPTMEQMQKALEVGFETCRYGFIQDNVVIPRINPNAICAANNTGVYVLPSNTSHYDTYCFNASAPLGEDCTSVTDLPNSFDGPVTITIVNRDGTRYSKTGEYRTHQEDIDASNIIDDDVSSGSSSEKNTPGGYIFHTSLPTEHPTGDEDRFYFTRSTPTTTRSGGKDGRRGPSLPKDTATSLEGYTPHYPDTMENGTLTPVAPSKTGVFEETEVTVAADSDFNVDGSLPGNLAICHLVCFSGEAIYLFLISGTFSVQAAIRLLCVMGMVFIIGHQF
ncbi:CD44 antigen [Lemmus lemmus]